MGGAGATAGSCLTGSGAAAAVSTTGCGAAGAANATGSEAGAAATAASTWRNRSAGTDCGNGAETEPPSAREEGFSAPGFS
ncbi:hypothetical protein NUKP71_42390 [Klebsiella quasipneumoniae]|nr:hypothetical protein NUKP71_42390 [Klebsiella quasipneumoniae]